MCVLTVPQRLGPWTGRREVSTQPCSVIPGSSKCRRSIPGHGVCTGDSGWVWGGSVLLDEPYPAPVVLFPRSGEELGVGDGDTTERQVHLQHLWTQEAGLNHPFTTGCRWKSSHFQIGTCDWRQLGYVQLLYIRITLTHPPTCKRAAQRANAGVVETC